MNKIFAEKIKKLLGEEGDKLIEALSLQPVRALRVNLRKITEEKLKDYFDLSTPVPYADSCFYFNGGKIGGHPFHHAGLFYMQEPSAMIVTEAIDLNGDETVLDMCAAPGGKTFALSQKLKNGKVLSNEIVPSRAAILYSNAERLGAENVAIISNRPEDICGRFDAVFVDAPCSGEGLFRRDEAAYNEWSPRVVEACALRQGKILDSAADLVAEGGALVYSTCTFSVEENESVIGDFLERHTDFVLQPVTPRVKAVTVGGLQIDDRQDYSMTARFYPHRAAGEGQFVAVMRRIGDLPPMRNGSSRNKNKIDSASAALVGEFMNKYLISCGEKEFAADKLCAVGGKICLAAFGNLREYNLISDGIVLGEVAKNRFKPSHYLFSALSARFRNKLELYGDERLIEYLKGGVLSAEVADGYGAITVLGGGVGGYKASQNILKNYYPKGLRLVKEQ